jgi:hypothetical protein
MRYRDKYYDGETTVYIAHKWPISKSIVFLCVQLSGLRNARGYAGNLLSEVKVKRLLLLDRSKDYSEGRDASNVSY